MAQVLPFGPGYAACVRCGDSVLLAHRTAGKPRFQDHYDTIWYLFGENT